MNFSRTDHFENRNWISLINCKHHHQQVVAQYVYNKNSENENKKTQRIQTFVLWTNEQRRRYSSLISKGRTNRRFEKKALISETSVCRRCRGNWNKVSNHMVMCCSIVVMMHLTKKNRIRRRRLQKVELWRKYWRWLRTNWHYIALN